MKLLHESTQIHVIPDVVVRWDLWGERQGSEVEALLHPGADISCPSASSTLWGRHVSPSQEWFTSQEPQSTLNRLPRLQTMRSRSLSLVYCNPAVFIIAGKMSWEPRLYWSIKTGCYFHLVVLHKMAWWLVYWEMSCIAHCSMKFAIYPKMTLNSWFSYPLPPPQLLGWQACISIPIVFMVSLFF